MQPDVGPSRRRWTRRLIPGTCLSAWKIDSIHLADSWRCSAQCPLCVPALRTWLNPQIYQSAATAPATAIATATATSTAPARRSAELMHDANAVPPPPALKGPSFSAFQPQAPETKGTYLRRSLCSTALPLVLGRADDETSSPVMTYPDISSTNRRPHFKDTIW
jgi:hypothetical protein